MNLKETDSVSHPSPQPIKFYPSTNNCRTSTKTSTPPLQPNLLISDSIKSEQINEHSIEDIIQLEQAKDPQLIPNNNQYGLDLQPNIDEGGPSDLDEDFLDMEQANDPLEQQGVEFGYQYEDIEGMADLYDGEPMQVQPEPPGASRDQDQNDPEADNNVFNDEKRYRQVPEEYEGNVSDFGVFGLATVRDPIPTRPLPPPPNPALLSTTINEKLQQLILQAKFVQQQHVDVASSAHKVRYLPYLNPPKLDAMEAADRSMRVTDEHGRCAWLHVAPDDEWGVGKGSGGGQSSGGGECSKDGGGSTDNAPVPSLLSTPIATLIDEYHKSKAATATQALTQRPLMTPTSARGGELWVDKYAPHDVMHLLTASKVTLQVMKWIKCWNKCVFGTPLSRNLFLDEIQREKEREAWREREGMEVQGGDVSKMSDEEIFKRFGGIDGSGRPKQKVLVLAGPPGVGKTTLAHVCAAHCGYTPIEINASDDRGHKVLTQKISDAIHQQAVLGSKKPKCVILDEVDGVAGSGGGNGEVTSAISALISFIEGKGGGKGKGSTGKGGVARPIIAITNDLYVPVLRKLREVGKVIHVGGVEQKTLIQRMQYVCQQEGLGVDRQVLSHLVSITQGDMRACLNTLQLLSRQTRHVTMAHMSANLGYKDMTQSAFNVWGQLLTHEKFHGGSSGRGQRGSVRGSSTPCADGQACSGGLGWEEHYDKLAAYGELDLTFLGLHHNMQHVPVPVGSNLQHMFADVYQHLAFADVALAKHTGARFAPVYALAIKRALCQATRVKMTWPQEHVVATKRAKYNRSMLLTWIRSTCPLTCQPAGLSVSTACSSVAPVLSRVCAPRTRDVQYTHMNKQEQQCINSTVSIMRQWNLTFDVNGPPAVSPNEPPPPPRPVPLSPAIDTLHQYVRASYTTRIAPVTKVIQSIANRLIYQIKSRKPEAAKKVPPAAKAPGQSGLTKGSATKRPIHEVVGGGLAGVSCVNSSGKGAKKIKKEKGFNWLVNMGRKSAQRSRFVGGGGGKTGGEGVQGGGSQVDGGEQSVGGLHLMYDVYFKFDEGYSNAVRKPLTMRELFKGEVFDSQGNACVPGSAGQ